MIDLDVVELAARKPWYCRSKQEDNLLSPEILVELITRLRQAEKDAARYRWLKEQGRHDYDVDDFFDGSCDIIDANVDEAMQCQQ
ncbi:MAG: hypothetical protein ACRCXB_14355 [Aeromonadaceae bacterium]